MPRFIHRLRSDNPDNYKQNRVIYFHILGQIGNATYVLILWVLTLDGHGRPNAFPICCGFIGAGFIATTLFSLRARTEYVTHPTSAKVQVGYGLFVTTISMYFYPRQPELFTIMYAGLYAWGLLRFKKKDFLLFGVAACFLYIANLAYLRVESGQYRDYLHVDLARILAFTSLIAWVGYLGGWTAEMRGKLRRLNRQLLHVDSVNPGLLDSADDTSDQVIRGKIRREIDLVTIGKAPFALAAIEPLDVVEIAEATGEKIQSRAFDALHDFLRARMRASDGVWLFNQGNRSLILILFPKTSAEAAAKSLKRIQGQAAKLTLLVPGENVPHTLGFAFGLTAYRYGETADELIGRAIAGCGAPDKPGNACAS